ncbi:MAG: aminomethyl transferase family protein, partial [Deltaproteobacteria bacterium]|nr:aminomethyl transferase family protein [Deltaproteobacteria bacterium]
MDMTEEMRSWHNGHGGRGEPWAPTGCSVADYGDANAEVEAGRADVLVVDRSRCARLQLNGQDRRDLLQRLTTNDLLALPEGKGAATTFTNGKGRIVDRVVVHAASDGDMIVGSAGRAEAIAAWIAQYVIREDVEVVDLTAATVQLDVLGPRAAELCHAPLVAFADLHELMQLDLGGVQVLAAKSDTVAGLTVRLIMPTGVAPRVCNWLVGRGARFGGSTAYNALRLEAGLPLYGPELNEEHNPLEAGLVDTLHFGKGCYVGQEVVARMDTYMKQRRYLIALETETPAPPPGSRLFLPNGDEGEVTSAADVGHGRARLLGYLKTEDPKVGMEVGVRVEGGTERKAFVVRRPSQAPAPKGGEGS